MTCATAVFDSPHKIRQQAVGGRAQAGIFFDDGEAGEHVELYVCVPRSDHSVASLLTRIIRQPGLPRSTQCFSAACVALLVETDLY
jgi:hypothetical protein